MKPIRRLSTMNSNVFFQVVKKTGLPNIRT